MRHASSITSSIAPGMRLRCNRGRLGRSADQGPDLNASGRGGESRSPLRHYGEERLSKSFGIYGSTVLYMYCTLPGSFGAQIHTRLSDVNFRLDWALPGR